MFVAFEGIDGSGKSELSGRVAAALGRDLDVCHLRPGGKLASPLSEQIRRICRDRAHLSMVPITELLLCAAREAQLLGEAVAPELGRRDVVITDRSMHSWRNLAVAGRGLEPSRADAICEAAAAGLWPDLIVLLDADPQLARARRKAAKIARRAEQPPRPKGRKGLAGVALQQRLRGGYLELAAAGGDRWLVIDNSGVDEAGADSLDDMAAAIAAHIRARIAGAEPPANVSRLRRRQRRRPRPAASELAPVLEWAGDRLYAVIDAVAEREPELAAYLTTRLGDRRAADVRRQLAGRVPANVAASLRGVGGDASFALREALIDRVPEEVARSLGGPDLDGDERAAAMRERLAERAPEAVLGSIAGDDSAAAWALRDRLGLAHPAATLASLVQLDSPAAWALRRRHQKRRDLARALLISVRGLDSDEAWALRAAISGESVERLRSVTGLDSDRAWALRDRLGARAPRVLFLGLAGVDSERAWALREDRLATAKEALDSLAGLDGERAWALRERGARIYPSTAVKSMVSVAPLSGERAHFAAELIAGGGDNVSLLRHAARLLQVGQA